MTKSLGSWTAEPKVVWNVVQPASEHGRAAKRTQTTAAAIRPSATICGTARAALPERNHFLTDGSERTNVTRRFQCHPSLNFLQKRKPQFRGE